MQTERAKQDSFVSTVLTGGSKTSALKKKAVDISILVLSVLTCTNISFVWGMALHKIGLFHYVRRKAS